MQAKSSFFPWPDLHPERGNQTVPIKSRKSCPESTVKGKPSQTALRNSQTIPQMWESLLQSKDFYSDGPAIFHQSKVKLTFRALDEISNAMAKNIAQIIDVSPATSNADGDSAVAFIVNENDQSEKVITLMMAILKLGLTYMPLSSAWHLSDLSWGLNVVKPVLLVVGESLSNEMTAFVEGIRTNTSLNSVILDILWNSAKVDRLALLNTNELSLDIRGSELWSSIPLSQRTVAIFFTSGSVSSPHAVRIGAREIYNRIHWQSKVFPTTHGDAYTLTSPISDPRSLVQIFAPLLVGKAFTIVPLSDQLHPEKLTYRIAESKLTRLTLTPPCFESLLDFVSRNSSIKERLMSVTHWFISGGALRVATARRFFQLFSGVHKSGVFLVIYFGTTEVLGEATYEVFFNASDLEKKIAPVLGTLSNGVPISNTSVSIVDRFDKTLPAGGRGEVVISGQCLASGGYVGQGNDLLSKFTLNDSTSKAKLKETIYFRTGDIGRILVDPQGIRRLYIEGRMDNETVQTGGATINLQQWMAEVMNTKLVRDATVFTYHRGRDTQMIVAAVVLKEGTTCAQVLDRLSTRKQYINERSELPTVFAVDRIPLLKQGRVDKKQLRILFRRVLLECNEADWTKLDIATEDLSATKFLCKAVALSIGLPLISVINGFQKPFWDIGGSPLNAIMVVKMCHDGGFPLGVKDFIGAKSIRELAKIVKKSEQTTDSWTQVDNVFDGKFTFNIIGMEDNEETLTFLRCDCPPLLNPNGVTKYWRGLLEGVQDEKLCVIAKLGRKVVGVALTGDTDVNINVPKPPKDISYGVELLDSCLRSSKYDMWRKSTGHVARCYFVGTTSSNVITPGERIVLIDELLTRTCMLGQSSKFSSMIISTANPIVQEVAIHLEGFETVLEFPVGRFKSKDSARPFTYADDNHSASVLLKNISAEANVLNPIVKSKAWMRSISNLASSGSIMAAASTAKSISTMQSNFSNRNN